MANIKKRKQGEQYPLHLEKGTKDIIREHLKPLQSINDFILAAIAEKIDKMEK